MYAKIKCKNRAERVAIEHALELPELRAMTVVVGLLLRQPEPERRRIMDYLTSRFPTRREEAR